MHQYQICEIGHMPAQTRSGPAIASDGTPHHQASAPTSPESGNVKLNDTLAAVPEGRNMLASLAFVSKGSDTDDLCGLHSLWG